MSSTIAVETVVEEKKEDPHSLIIELKKMENPSNGPPLSPSKRRAKAAGSNGLSELSKQLRIFQAKNEAQAVEINRLERQLRILAELQGISVVDLRKALEDACAHEAFGEMQHRVAKLRAELEGAMLAKQNKGRQDAVAPHIANLELRVGELEEVEEKQQDEIHHLYEQLRHERARATRLEAEGDQSKKDSQDYLGRLNKESARGTKLEATFQEQLQKMHEEQALKMQQLASQQAQLAQLDSAASKSTASSISPEMAADYERMCQSLKKKDEALRKALAALKAEQEKWLQHMKETDGQARQVQVDRKVDQDQMALTIKELQDADSQNELRLAQYKARFAIQDERIQDMGQQLDSLYTAFNLLKEDHDTQDMHRSALKCNLDEADAEVAKHVSDLENKQQHRGGSGGAPAFMAGSPPRKRVQSFTSSQQERDVPRVISTTPSTVGSQSTGMVSPPPSASARAVNGTPVQAYAAQPFGSSLNSPATPTTWQLLFPDDSPASRATTLTPNNHSGQMISGVLIVKSNSRWQKWKSKYCKISLRGDHYKFNIGDWKTFRVEFGVSKVEFYPNYPLSFIVHTNPFDSTAPVIHAAAMNEADYHRWMAALTRATTGGEYHMDVQEPRRVSETTPGSPRTTGGFSTTGESQRTGGSSSAEQEAAELQRALEISQSQF